MKRLLILLALARGLVFSGLLYAEPPHVGNSHKTLNPPPRIIRKCCPFGTDVRLAGIPWSRFSEITSIEKIGPHRYLGQKEENNGIIYTLRGGFIDLGHLRDQADWTAFLYGSLLEYRGCEKEIFLGHEGGSKYLKVSLPEEMPEKDVLLLAQRIAYDLSIWHEIATWFGASLIPFLPERYSSFSVEDNYSNLLGVYLGGMALSEGGLFEKNMDRLIMTYIQHLEPVDCEEDTRKAMESVLNIWWTNEKPLPSGKILIKRQMEAYPAVHPWLVPNQDSLFCSENHAPVVLNVPTADHSGNPLSGYYQLEFDTNGKIPVKEIKTAGEMRSLTQLDFPVVIDYIREKEETAHAVPTAGISAAMKGYLWEKFRR
ncbi:MAG: DUF4056 domain-containing protein [Bacteroidia bacterium]